MSSKLGCPLSRADPVSLALVCPASKSGHGLFAGVVDLPHDELFIDRCLDECKLTGQGHSRLQVAVFVNVPDLSGKVRCEEFGSELTEIGGEVVDVSREEPLGVVVGGGVLFAVVGGGGGSFCCCLKKAGR